MPKTKVSTDESASKAKRPEFDLTVAVGADGAPVSLSDEGRLMGVPANWNNEYRPLKRTSFDSKELFFDYRIAQVDAQIARLNDRKEELADQRTGNVDTTKKNIKRRARILRQLAELDGVLASQGVDPGSL